jgi:flagellar motor protein MotB
VIRRGKIARKDSGTGHVWQIIYMDLMTTMMVYFVILWSADQGVETQGGISDTIGNQTVRMVSLPGDILFASGKAQVTEDGKKAFKTLFEDPAVLNFDMGGLVRRQLVIHGHTDEVGKKDDNFELGYERARAVYREIRKYSKEVPDHIVLCTHADNTPARPVPPIKGTLTDEQRALIRAARAKNRRITIEDKQVSSYTGE